jgi:hypothetical protein
VWGGADLAEPVAIDGGRTVWLFGDTYIGGGPYGGPLDTQGFVHNSMVIQFWGSCFSYLFGGDATTGWYSAIPDQADGTYYWPSGGAFDPATGLLSVMALVVRTTVPNDPWGWELVGADVIRYRVSDMTMVEAERLFTYGEDDSRLFGLSLLSRGGRVYLYGCTSTGPEQCFVARTDTLLHTSSLRYWSNGAWLADPERATPIGWTDPVGARLFAGNVAGGVLASTQIQVTGAETWGWLGSSPTGPFAPIGRFWDTTTGPAGPLPSNWFTYQGRTITTSAGTIGMFNVNTNDDEAARVAGVYGPRFLGPSAPHLYLRDSLSTGTATRDHVFAAPVRGTVMMCDWNGDGVDTPVVFRNGWWYFTDGQTGGGWEQGFGYGDAGDRPICGDWDGDGTDTPGVVRGHGWYLSNTTGKPWADVAFGYGNPTDTPVVGDWDGDGTDTPGVVRDHIWYLSNTAGRSVADMAFGYGDPTDRPVVGDWDGDGTDAPGVVRGFTWYLSNTAGRPLADVAFDYGDPTDAPIVGRWAPGAPTTIGIARPTF